MTQVPLEIVQSSDCRPLPVVQQASSIDEHVASTLQILLLCLVRLFDLENELPKPELIVPDGRNQLVKLLDVLLHTMLLRNGLEVGVNLDRTNIVVTVVRVRFECVSVCVSRNITGTSRISILQPGPAYVTILLVNCEVAV